MLSYPYSFTEQDYLPPQSHQTNSSMDLLTNSFDPSFLDDFTFLDTLSSSLPSNDHHAALPFSSQPFDGLTGMNFDHSSSFDQPTTLGTIVPPLLSQSFSPEPTFLSPEYHQQPQPQPSFPEPNHLLKPQLSSSHKGHRRRRSSSVPSLFHSVKKRHVQSIPPAAGNTNPSYSAQPIIYVPSPHTKPLPIQIQRASRQSPPPTELNQAQLDAKLLQVNFNDVTVAELKDYLRERNLSVAGRKAELTQRLYNERQQVHARSKSASPSSILSSPSPQPMMQQLTYRLDDLDIQASFLKNADTRVHQPQWQDEIPLFNQF